ncbi:RDD family protein [Streptomyces sp. NPDC047928]|uniref:RDD family protein n=1 Tax=unclassified Streptomyces TaxID=2593676 RepID=UPI003710AC0D
MSDEPPASGRPPEDDRFRKPPQDSSEPPPAPPPPPPGSGGPYGGSPYGGGSPYDGGGGHGGGGGFGYGGADPLAGMPPLAESGKRILARLIDWLIIAVPLALLVLPLNIYRWTTDGDRNEGFADAWQSGGQWGVQLIGILAYIGYDTYMTQRNGQTFGKRLMGLRVAMLNDGTVPPTNVALIRALVLWLPTLICCACLWPLLLLVLILVDKPYKQGLHDKAAKTVVVSATQ